ncbi:hypothetical protein LZ31DRAFT_467975, partial [Colletotrichum somersetense]
QREFRCNHVRWIVSRWCPLYARTQRRCPPHVTHCEYRYVLLYCFFFSLIPPSHPSTYMQITRVQASQLVSRLSF